MPPAPSFERISYGPSFEPEARGIKVCAGHYSAGQEWERNSGSTHRLLGQAEPPHQVFVTRIRAQRVERGIADVDQEFTISVGVGFVQVLKRLVAISEKRRSHGYESGFIRPRHLQVELKIAFRVRAYGDGFGKGNLKLVDRIGKAARHGIEVGELVVSWLKVSIALQHFLELCQRFREAAGVHQEDGVITVDDGRQRIERQSSSHLVHRFRLTVLSEKKSKSIEIVRGCVVRIQLKAAAKLGLRLSPFVKVGQREGAGCVGLRRRWV